MSGHLDAMVTAELDFHSVVQLIFIENNNKKIDSFLHLAVQQFKKLRIVGWKQLRGDL